MMVPPRAASHAAAYYLLLVGTWTGYVALVYPRFWRADSIAAIVVHEVCRVVLFAGPVLVLTRRWSPNPATALGVTGRWRTGLATGLVVGALWFLTVVVGAMAMEGKSLRVSPIPLVFWFTAFSTATVLEEVVFRGFLLQSFEPFGKGRAIALSTACFVAIHYPGWWLRGTHAAWQGWVVGSASIGLLGVLLGIVFWRVRSIWATVLIHAAHNLAATLTEPPAP